MGLAEYLISALPSLAALGISGGWLTPQKVVAVVTVIVLTMINCVGLRTGKRTQNGLTVLKIAGLAIFIVACLFVTRPVSLASTASLPATGAHMPGLAALAAALIGISFAYLGWDAATYVAAESVAPQRDLPRALLYGTAIVMATYLLFNLALYRVDPSCDPHKVLDTIFGPMAGMFISIVIMLCILGAMNATIIVGPRVGYAMARDGLFFKQIAAISPVYQVPARAIILQGAWTTIILLTGTFSQILTGAVVAMLTLSIVTAAAVLVLRIRRPSMARPYMVWGYPVVPLLYCLGTAAILYNTLAGDMWMLMRSVMVVIAGIPVFLIIRRLRT